jgi:four helix bundle protein
MLNLNHKNLQVWKRSIELVTEIYIQTNKFPDSEKFGLISQLRRAAVSIPSNIAEGASRKSKIERIRFYEISRSSLVELDTQVEISILLGFISKDDVKIISEHSNAIFAMLSKMIK